MVSSIIVVNRLLINYFYSLEIREMQDYNGSLSAVYRY